MTEGATTHEGRLRFELLGADGSARRGRVTTAHSVIETPVFMPVGTVGAVKAMTAGKVGEMDARIILGNSYHLYLRPGLDVLRDFGGLHAFMGWDRSLLTDSGGFQVFSLKGLRKLGDEGVEFRSHIDGSKHFFTPEKVMEIQRVIGSDIAMCLDDCPALPAKPSRLDASLARTTAWALRSLEVERPPWQNLFAIVQGGLDVDRRLRHVETLGAHGFDGFALGGLSVGETPAEMYETVGAVAPAMPVDKPRYLMGVGTPIDLIECVARGIDMFDCVLPTRNARMGTLYTREGRLNITRAEFRHSTAPIDEQCGCETCRTVSRGYIRHLLKAKEITGMMLTTIHNVRFFLDLMTRIRGAIETGTLAELRAEMGAVERW